MPKRRMFVATIRCSDGKTIGYENEKASNVIIWLELRIVELDEAGVSYSIETSTYVAQQSVQ